MSLSAGATHLWDPAMWQHQEGRGFIARFRHIEYFLGMIKGVNLYN